MLGETARPVGVESAQHLVSAVAKHASVKNLASVMCNRTKKHTYIDDAAGSIKQQV